MKMVLKEIWNRIVLVTLGQFYHHIIFIVDIFLWHIEPAQHTEKP